METITRSIRIPLTSRSSLTEPLKLTDKPTGLPHQRHPLHNLQRGLRTRAQPRRLLRLPHPHRNPRHRLPRHRLRLHRRHLPPNRARHGACMVSIRNSGWAGLWPIPGRHPRHARFLAPRPVVADGAGWCGCVGNCVVVARDNALQALRGADRVDEGGEGEEAVGVDESDEGGEVVSVPESDGGGESCLF